MNKILVRTILIIVLSLVVLTACSPRDALYGKWRADQGGYLIEFQRGGTLRMGNALSITTRFEFIDDYTIRVAPGETADLNLNGEISFAVEGNTLILTVARQPMQFSRVR